jgi:hypothetical protein
MIKMTSPDELAIAQVCDGDKSAIDQSLVNQLQERLNINMKSIRQMYTVEEANLILPELYASLED